MDNFYLQKVHLDGKKEKSRISVITQRQGQKGIHRFELLMKKHSFAKGKSKMLTLFYKEKIFVKGQPGYT